jgi:UDP-N-acetylglucosamine acyltransferase
MGNKKIHPMAVVEAGAVLGNDVTIEPFAVVKSNAILKDRTVVKSHAYIDGNTTIGEGTIIYPFASIGTKTQDLKFRGEKTYVTIGENCEIREGVTINSSCQEGSIVSVGNNCLLMAYCHVAHNCVVGNNVIMSNNATLAGHVTVEDFAIIGGMTPIHQFSRIGCFSFVGGMSRVTHDVPPYTIGGGIPFKMGGLNIIGMKRRGLPFKTRSELSKAFKYVYRSGLRLDEALERIEKDLEQIPEIKHFVQFCRQSERGLICLQGITQSSDQLETEEEEEVEKVIL